MNIDYYLCYIMYYKNNPIIYWLKPFYTFSNCIFSYVIKIRLNLGKRKINNLFKIKEKLAMTNL